MKALIVEDDFTCRRLLQEFLKFCVPFPFAVNGNEAIEGVRCVLDQTHPEGQAVGRAVKGGVNFMKGRISPCAF